MKSIIDKIVEKTKKNIEIFGENIPRAEVNGVYEFQPLRQWTTGFWGGLLWINYLFSGDEKFKKCAEALEERMDELIFERNMPQHDVGFMWLLTSGINYNLTKNETSRRRLLQMADHLAARFNIKGNFIRAWDMDGAKGVAIIDCMMNIPLLFLASKELNDPRFAHIAKAHADKTLEYFIDDDGAVRHQCQFDEETGELVEIRGGQGYAPDSSWARGASWAIYGFAMMYRNTKDKKYLDAAEKVAKFFLNEIKEDFVPAWDFRAPNKELKDSSAGAIAACGMLEISDFAEDKEFYVENAKKILEALYEKCASSESQSILSHGTGNLPNGKEIDTGLIYGDYYFAEAILRLNGKNKLLWQED